MKPFVLVALAGLVLAERPADACSCSPPPPPCERFWTADYVFTGKVLAVASGSDHVDRATIQVKEKFRGTLGKSILVEGGGMCGASFEAGREYFIYAGNGSGGGALYAGLCGRTRRIDDAADDLAYARNQPTRTASVIEGTVRLEGEDGKQAPRAGAEVHVQGTSTHATTGADGRYKIQIAPGNYTLDVVDAGTKVRWDRNPQVALPDAAACASRDIVVVWDGKIRGTIVDHTGKPAANVEVSAHAAVGGKQNWRLSGRTDAHGNYTISEVQRGTYVVAVNHVDDGGPDASLPVPTTFYPGVQAEAKAKPVVMNRAGVVERIDFKLGKPMPVYTFSGVVKKQGKPLAGVHVNFDTKLGDKYGRRTGNPTDAAGRFAFKDVAGADVTLEVCRPDAGPQNYQTACRFVKRKLDKDIVVDVEYPQ